jgi:hypothetical protein
MSDCYSKTLASTLYGKLGGNVNHDFKSVFCELTDNSLDEGATEIKAWCDSHVENKFYTLYFQDNGNGVKDIYNLLNGSSGKKNKIGKKNSGFTDSLVWITQLSESLEVFSVHNFQYKYNKISFNESTLEYETQLSLTHEEEPVIKYDDIWKIMKPNIDNLTNKNAIIGMLKDFDINNFEKGTVFRFRYKKSNDLTELLLKNEIEYYDGKNKKYEMDNFANYIQSVIQKYNFKLNFGRHNENKYEIGVMNDFNRTDIYTPAIFDLKLGRRDNEILGYVSSNLPIDYEVYFKHKEDTKTKIIEKTSFDNLKEVYNMSSDIGIRAYLTCLNDEHAIEQKDNFQSKALEDLRGVTFMSMGRILGASVPFTDLKIYGSQLRNFHNIRLLLDISDKKIIKQLTMLNKSSLNISELCPSVNLFIKGIFNNFIKKKFHVNEVKDVLKTEIKQNGIINMVEFLSEEGIPPPPPPPIPINLHEFGTSIYFGIFNAKKNGLKLTGENEDSITCKYGFTEDNPKERDAGQSKADLSGFLRIFSTFIDNNGGEIIDGTNKIRCENDIFNILSDSGLVTSWYKNSKEIFTCKMIHYKQVKEIVRRCCIRYERDFI